MGKKGRNTVPIYVPVAFPEKWPGPRQATLAASPRGVSAAGGGAAIFTPDRQRKRTIALMPFLAILCALLALPGLAGKEAVARPLPAAAVSAASGTQIGKQPGAGAPAATGASVNLMAGKAAAPALNAAQIQMLQSVDREPAAVQPEEDYRLYVPENVGDGEPFLLEFGAAGVRKIVVNWRGKNLSLLSSDKTRPGPMQVLLPVPLDEKSSGLPLLMTVHWDDGRVEKYSAILPVVRRTYPMQRLTVEQKFVTPPASVAEKIKQDRAEMRAALSQVSPRQNWTLPMLRPVPGEVTSLFGLRRVFNDQPRNPHKGIDFDAQKGDPIAALDNGVAVLVSEHYYGGKTVVVDHGLGVHSIYLHLSEFAVSKGQQVARGETIGFVGSTGRVTGPHLHLSLSVLGQSVNAAPCLEMKPAAAGGDEF